MQKTDTNKIYAMKTLRKDEMLKKDQVRFHHVPRYTIALTALPRYNPTTSSHTSAQSAMFWPNPIRHGSYNYTTRSRIPHTSI